MSRQTSRGTATVRQLCQAFDLSRSAFYAARQRADQPAKVATPPRPTRRGPWASAEDLEAGIVAIVDEHPAWGVRKVWAVLRRRGVRASQKRVWAMMKHLGLTLPPARERDPDAPRGQVVVPDSNRRWASDLTTAWTKRDGVVAIVPVIDCGDRVALSCTVSVSQESPAVLAATELALEDTFGDPEAVPDGLEWRTDHGPQFTGGDAGDLCERWRLDHTLAPVGRPTGNAVAERFIQTLKVELIWTRDWDSAAELRAAIEVWLRDYNEQRPHQALDWQTPVERRMKNLGGELCLAA